MIYEEVTDIAPARPMCKAGHCGTFMGADFGDQRWHCCWQCGKVWDVMQRMDRQNLRYMAVMATKEKL